MTSYTLCGVVSVSLLELMQECHGVGDSDSSARVRSKAMIEQVQLPKTNEDDLQSGKLNAL